MSTITWFDHYKVEKISSIQEIRDFFDKTEDEETDFTLNWLFLSTSGIHGSYATLDDLDFKNGFNAITVLIVCPRLVVLRYGDIKITPDDIPYLQNLVKKSIAGIIKSQARNLKTLNIEEILNEK